MTNGKGSKLLLGLIIQGAVLGSLVLYKRVKGEKPADDLSSTIDELEKKEQDKAQSKEQPKAEKSESLADELLNNIENFGKVAKDTVETIKPTLNLVDEVVNAFKKEVNNASNAAKTSTKPQETKKEETPKPQPKAEEKPVVKPQAKAEDKQAPTAPVTKVQEPSKEVTGNRTTKTASQVDEDFLTRITSYGQQAEKPAEEVVVAKNKVNLPKPPTAQKQAKPAATKKIEAQKPAAQAAKPKTKPAAPKKVTKPAENKKAKSTEAKKD